MDELKPYWISVSKRLPDPETSVLICATRKLCDGRKIQVRSLAMYEDGKTVTENSGFDWNNEDFEYDEKSDSFVIPEGWWEYPVYSESFSAVDDFVTHWLPLPQPPKEDADEAAENWNRRTAPENKPLTLEKLRQMVGEPVWIQRGKKGTYRVVKDVSYGGEYGGEVRFTDSGPTGLRIEDYGKTWVPYARKPEVKK